MRMWECGEVAWPFASLPLSLSIFGMLDALLRRVHFGERRIHVNHALHFFFAGAFPSASASSSSSFSARLALLLSLLEVAAGLSVPVPVSVSVSVYLRFSTPGGACSGRASVWLAWSSVAVVVFDTITYGWSGSRSASVTRNVSVSFRCSCMSSITVQAVPSRTPKDASDRG